MDTSENLELMRLITVIVHDAMTNDAAGYKKLVEAAVKEADSDTPSFLATFRYLHSNLSDLLISDNSATKRDN